jgi:hypothetical protein
MLTGMHITTGASKRTKVERTQKTEDIMFITEIGTMMFSLGSRAPDRKKKPPIELIIRPDSVKRWEGDTTPSTPYTSWEMESQYPPRTCTNVPVISRQAARANFLSILFKKTETNVRTADMTITKTPL